MLKTAKKILWLAVNQLAQRASRNYIAGAKLEDAQRVSTHLNKLGYWVTLGYWDSENDDLTVVTDAYHSSIEHLASLAGKNYLSIKLPAINFDHGKFQELLAKSQESNIPLHFDSLAPENANHNYAFAMKYANQSSYGIGCTLPARWQRSIADADIVSQLELNVRVVKGQWKDPDYPDLDARSAYLNIINRLAGKLCHVRVATHDLELAKKSLAILKEKNTYCELELLYGLPINGLVALANQLNIPVRIYIAFGHAYLPYALSSISKHPYMVWKLFKEAYKSDYISTFKECTSNNNVR